MTPPIPYRVAERAATRYEENEDGCWISTYSVGSHGYAQIGWSEGGRHRMTTVHRAAWTYHRGPIPEDMTIDHRCHVRRCVRPQCLRLLTNVENASDNRQVVKARPTTRLCGAGLHQLHLYPNGKHGCLSCKAARQRRYRADRKAPPAHG